MGLSRARVRGARGRRSGGDRVAERLMRVARPIFMRPDLEYDDDLDPHEREAVEPVFTEAAARFGYMTLNGLTERERSLRNAASRATDKEERARRTGLADDVKTEIEQALARGQVVVIRRRSTNAVTGKGACGPVRRGHRRAVGLRGLHRQGLERSQGSHRRREGLRRGAHCRGHREGARTHKRDLRRRG
jgi:hypothetical protein